MDKQQREYIHHLMLQYSDAMVRLTYRRVGDWHLAEDLVQEIILLRIDKGYSFLELAEHFGISEMACRQRLSRALHKCRTLLEEPLGSTPK